MSEDNPAVLPDARARLQEAANRKLGFRSLRKPDDRMMVRREDLQWLLDHYPACDPDAPPASDATVPAGEDLITANRIIAEAVDHIGAALTYQPDSAAEAWLERTGSDRRRLAAAAPKVASDTALSNSWVNTPKAEREQAMLLAEVELHLQQCRVFITSREKMHPCGVDLHDELQAKVTAALDAIGREKAHG